MHVLRNMIDHGIEDAEGGAALWKRYWYGIHCQIIVLTQQFPHRTENRIYNINMKLKLVLILLMFIIGCKSAEANFWQAVQSNISKAFRPSKFVCTKYETQEYEVPVLRAGMKLPFTERKTKLRKCKRWENAPKSAVGKVCKEYEYVNTTSKEQKSLYTTVKRKRTVCVEGHSTR